MPASTHSRDRRWAELLEQMPVGLSAFHRQAVRRTRGLWHPGGWGPNPSPIRPGGPSDP